MLDVEASRQCLELVRGEPTLFSLEDELLRLPAQSFWVEWFSDPDDDGGGFGRLGALVECGRDGRSGVITGFFGNRGRADLVVAATEFDLNHGLDPRDQHSFQVRHPELPHIDALLRHAVFHVDPRWAVFFRTRSEAERRRDREELGAAAWFHLPVVLAFSAMLNADGVVDAQPRDLQRLNAARRKRGKPAMLDHIEVTMRLGSRRAATGLELAGGGRVAPRLHHVRGHLVRRGNTTFWRSSHLRGDRDRVLASRTVRVLGSASARRNAWS
jgi:hypothetical protein